MSHPQDLVDNIRQTVLGQDDTIRLVVSALLAGGHVLLDDVPGVGKTLLAKALAQSVAGLFKRIQCSPDLMPSDVTGVNVYQPTSGRFSFVPGPIFANVLLADEINRASPRTQSSLLEAMEEGKVSIDGETHPLPRPFLVIATQNPVEFQGTFPLPEAQLDRFAVVLSMGYPSPEEERRLLAGQWAKSGEVTLSPVCDAERLLVWQAQTREVRVDVSLQDYIVQVANATRNHPEIALGISPRGSLMWQRLGQAHAFLAGRDYLTPDDLRTTAKAALAHRLVVRKGRGAQKSLLAELLESLPVPV